MRREVDENWAVLGHYVASSGHFLPTFRDDLSVPSSGAKNPSPLKIESFAHEDEVFLGGGFLTIEDGTDRFFPKRRFEITTTRCAIIQKSAFLTCGD